jgi:hypothetical protein
MWAMMPMLRYLSSAVCRGISVRYLLEWVNLFGFGAPPAFPS